MKGIQEIDYFDYLYIQSTDDMTKKIVDNLIKEGSMAIRKRHTKSKVSGKKGKTAKTQGVKMTTKKEKVRR